MSSTFFSGLVSGLDTTALIDALVTARSGPIVQLQRRQAERTAELSAWKSVEATLISLKIESDRIGQASFWDTLRVESSDADAVTASADSDAALGSYEFHVVELAQAHQIRSQAYGSSDELVGSGTLTLDVAGESTDIEVAAGTSLAELADRINDADAGVSATILRSEEAGTESFYLVLGANETGAENEIQVTSALSGAGAPDLSTEIRAAKDAHIQFGGVGGLDLYSTTNTFEDVVDGLTVVAHQPSDENATVVIDVSRDTETIEEGIATFVERYNTVMSFINNQSKFDSELGVRPTLFGDTTLAQVASSLRARVSGFLLQNEQAPFRTLFSVGLKSTTDGTLTFDSEAFRTAFEEDADAVANLFRVSTQFDGPSGVELLFVPPALSLDGGELDVVITQVASTATITSGELDFSSDIRIKNNNNTFRIAIDGVLSEDLTIANGNYADGESLVAAIRDAIDQSEQLGSVEASVSFVPTGADTGRIVITTPQFGSETSLRLESDTPQFDNTLGFSGQLDVTFTGTDVAGTINGVAAEGEGRILTAGDDSGDLAGLSLRVDLDPSALPVTATLRIAQGAGRSVSHSLLALTETRTGTLARVANNIQGQIDRLDRDITAQQERLERRRERLQTQYARLESLMAQFQSQGAFLAAQISAANSAGGFSANT